MQTLLTVCLSYFIFFCQRVIFETAAAGEVLFSLINVKRHLFQSFPQNLGGSSPMGASRLKTIRNLTPLPRGAPLITNGGEFSKFLR